jgi:methyl-accepting chemotaxis protein
VGLQHRLQILIQAFLVVILLGVQHWLSERLEHQALNAARERTHAIADGVNNGLNTLMDIKLDGKDVISDAASRALFIQRLGVSDKLLELRVVRAKGTNDEYGEGLPQEQPVDEIDRRVLADGKPAFHMGEHGDDPKTGSGTLRAVLPSIAYKEYRDSKCLRCHGVDAGTVLGLVSVTVDIRDDLAAIRQINTWLWLGQGVLQVLLYLVIGLVVRRALRPLGAEPAAVTALAQGVAQGDLSRPIALAPDDEHSMMAQLRTMQASLGRVVGQVRRASDGVATASTEIAQGNGDLSARTEHQASTLEQTAAAMEQLNGTVSENAGRAREASQLAQHASTVASQAGAVVGEVVQTMQGINDASHRIAEIIGVIDGIAFQTNILALNAAVEAARAGEQGRGFAVVAAEVRSLAQRSAEAAREIKGLIGTSVERVEQGTRLVDQAGRTMNEVVASIATVTRIVAEISVASQEQSTGLSQVVEAISQMDGVTQQNAALVEQTAAAAASLKEQAVKLADEVSRFRLPA